MTQLFDENTPQKFFLLGHCIWQAKNRFYKNTPEAILALFKNSLANARIMIESNSRITLCCLEENSIIKAARNKKGVFIITIYPLNQAGYYTLHPEIFEKRNPVNLSNIPLIFANTNLYEKNIISMEMKKCD